MNENLKKLLEQASIYAFDSRFVPGDNPRHVADVIQEKFAELIVRECAKFLDENSGADQCNNVWCPAPEDLLKHFGVEE